MDCAVIFSEKALTDLEGIATFIATNDPQTAAVFANRLVDLAESLRRLPERGRPVKRWANVRVIVLAPYLIFYRFEASLNRVEILRFWHGARDPGILEM